MQPQKINEIDPQIFLSFQYNTIEDAGLDMLYLLAKSKHSDYLSECGRFESKYSMLFEQFRDKTENRINKENFEEEDDLLAWRFAFENASYWGKKIKELERCF